MRESWKPICIFLMLAMFMVVAAATSQGQEITVEKLGECVSVIMTSNNYEEVNMGQRCTLWLTLRLCYQYDVDNGYIIQTQTDAESIEIFDKMIYGYFERRGYKDNYNKMRDIILNSDFFEIYARSKK